MVSPISQSVVLPNDEGTSYLVEMRVGNDSQASNGEGGYVFWVFAKARSEECRGGEEGMRVCGWGWVGMGV